MRLKKGETAFVCSRCGKFTIGEPSTEFKRSGYKSKKYCRKCESLFLSDLIELEHLIKLCRLGEEQKN